MKSIIPLILIIYLLFTSFCFGQSQRDELLKSSALNYLAQQKLDVAGVGAENINFNHKRTDVDKYGNGHSRYQISYKGIPIYGNVIIVHLDKNNIPTRNSGGTIPKVNYNISVQPTISAENAIVIVKEQMGIDAEISFLDTTLMIWDGELLDVSFKSRNLIYKIYVTSTLPYGEWIYFVDAHTSSIINYFDNIKYARDREQ